MENTTVVLECADEDPLAGTWKELGMMKRADEDEFSFTAFSLDATVFENKGNYYYVWAEKVGTGKQISNLYIAQMGSTGSVKDSAGTAYHAGLQTGNGRVLGQ